MYRALLKSTSSVWLHRKSDDRLVATFIRFLLRQNSFGNRNLSDFAVEDLRCFSRIGLVRDCCYESRSGRIPDTECRPHDPALRNKFFWMSVRFIDLPDEYLVTTYLALSLMSYRKSYGRYSVKLSMMPKKIGRRLQRLFAAGYRHLQIRGDRLFLMVEEKVLPFDVCSTGGENGLKFFYDHIHKLSIHDVDSLCSLRKVAETSGRNWRQTNKWIKLGIQLGVIEFSDGKYKLTSPWVEEPLADKVRPTPHLNDIVTNSRWTNDLRSRSHAYIVQFIDEISAKRAVRCVPATVVANRIKKEFWDVFKTYPGTTAEAAFYLAAKEFPYKVVAAPMTDAKRIFSEIGGEALVSYFCYRLDENVTGRPLLCITTMPYRPKQLWVFHNMLVVSELGKRYSMELSDAALDTSYASTNVLTLQPLEEFLRQRCLDLSGNNVEQPTAIETLQKYYEAYGFYCYQ